MLHALWPIALPFVAASAWWWGRRSIASQQTLQLNKLSHEYYIGLNYLLNEQPDKAVDIFIRLLEIDGDTAETHLALGSLFRRRGEVDRAIRIHQNLIARPKLNQVQRIEALIALGRDYMSAGVLDRAERVFREVVALGGSHTVVGLRYLLDIYQQEKAWEEAIRAAKKLAQLSEENTHQVVAHAYCELAETAKQHNQMHEAQRFLQKALNSDPSSVRAALAQAALAEMQGEYAQAIHYYKRVKEQNPDFLSEAIMPMVRCYTALQQDQDCIDYLLTTLQEYPRVAIILVLAERIRVVHGLQSALDFFTEQMARNPSLRGLKRLIAWHMESAEGRVKDKLTVLYKIVEKLVANKPIYRCAKCGFAAKQLSWQCPSCKVWNQVKPIHGLEGD